jgi:predicted TIM-barrel fold metal-dependent hydrolase
MNEKLGTPNEHGRVDVHHHMVPSFYLEALARVGVGTSGFPTWTPEQSLLMMDRLGISKAILSLSPPGVWFGHDADARELARSCNEYAAELVEKHPARFGALAILPFPDPEGAEEELAYALDTLQLNGVLLLTNVDGMYVGDPESETLMASSTGVRPGYSSTPTMSRPKTRTPLCSAGRSTHSTWPGPTSGWSITMSSSATRTSSGFWLTPAARYPF